MDADPPAGFSLVRRGPFTTFVGPILQFDASPPGRVRLGLRVNDNHINTMGYLHGGMAATLADSAMARALVFLLKPKAVTLNLSIDYEGGVRLADWLEADAWVEHEDGEFGHTACEMRVGEEVRLRASAVFRILRRT